MVWLSAKKRALGIYAVSGSVLRYSHVILYLSTCNISNLATLGWAMYLEAGETTDSDSNEYSFFSVGISLTDAGHGQFSFIFAYLDLD